VREQLAVLELGIGDEGLDRLADLPEEARAAHVGEGDAHALPLALAHGFGAGLAGVGMQLVATAQTRALLGARGVGLGEGAARVVRAEEARGVGGRDAALELRPWVEICAQTWELLVESARALRCEIERALGGRAGVAQIALRVEICGGCG